MTEVLGKAIGNHSWIEMALSHSINTSAEFIGFFYLFINMDYSLFTSSVAMWCFSSTHYSKCL